MPRQQQQQQHQPKKVCVFCVLIFSQLQENKSINRENPQHFNTFGQTQTHTFYRQYTPDVISYLNFSLSLFFALSLA